MRSTALLSGIALQPGTLRAVLLDRLTRSLGKDPQTATQRDIYDALSLAVREELAARWLATQRRVSQAGVKRICYFSVEYLLGRNLVNGLASLEVLLACAAGTAVFRLLAVRFGWHTPVPSWVHERRRRREEDSR